MCHFDYVAKELLPTMKKKSLSLNNNKKSMNKYR